ncbi:hypothetical protein GGR52DRAFT_590407 [Hypoxylon sp. FL1284]|nr:hypothetical protein GGR52DRAFT_590407 [Hypoxylon sp. FL1284]
MSNIASRLERLAERLGDRFFQVPVGGQTGQNREPAENVERRPEPTMLWHDNISLDNILVDEDGILRGIIGWECVSCLPLFEACQLPAFLQQSHDTLTQPPDLHTIAWTKADGSQDHKAYQMELKRYHTTWMRLVFLKEMMDICPAWTEVFQSVAQLKDFEAAVQHCDNEFAYETVERWLNDVEGSGNSWVFCLHEALMS